MLPCGVGALGIFTLQRGLLAAQAFTQQVVGAVDSGVDAVRYRGEPRLTSSLLAGKPNGVTGKTKTKAFCAVAG